MKKNRIEANIRNYQSRKYGLNNIRSKLLQRDFDKEIILEVLNDYNKSEESNNLKALINKKYLILDDKYSSLKKKKKIIQLCLSKGYSYKDINANIKEIDLL
jgi:SOS response regulatory protein OraA/RecX